jgi:peptidoglycan/xylan/chitin deacetylase (PgdA/CDA1 family)
MIKKQFFSFLRFIGITSLIAWWNRKQVMILCYHNVTPRPDLIPNDPWKMYLDTGLFDSQLDYLQKKYNVISLQEFLEARRNNQHLPPYSVVLTFDDGKRNFFTVVFPRLSSRRLPATVFIVVDNTKNSTVESYLNLGYEWTPNDDHDDLSWNDIKALLRQPDIIQIGSHSHTHPVLSHLSKQEAQQELIFSFEGIATNIKNRPIPLAYPHGQTSEEIMKLAESVGYACGLTNMDAGNDFGTPLFNLNRTIINSDDSICVFAARLAGITWRINKIKNRLKRLKSKFALIRKEKTELNQNFIKNS